MNTSATPSAIAAQAEQLAIDGKAKNKDLKQVALTVKLSAAEHVQLTDLRDSLRSTGLQVTKAKLLRAAVTLINQQSSFKIEEQLQVLASLKKTEKKAERKKKK